MFKASKIEVGHVTLTSPLYGWFVIRRLGLDIATAYTLCVKFDNSI